MTTFLALIVQAAALGLNVWAATRSINWGAAAFVAVFALDTLIKNNQR